MRNIKFKDFVTLQRGFDLPKTEMREGLYPVIGSTSIIGYHDEYKILPPGVITGRSGSLGKVQYIEKNYWPHNTSLWVKDFKGNQPRYVYYFLQTLDLAKFNAGAGVPTLNRNHLDELDISIHDEPIQRKIADILSAYDDLIEVNARRIRVLEAMAQSVYREWFGNVDTKSLPRGWEIKPFSKLVDIDPTTSVDKQIEKSFVGMNALSTNSMIINLDLVETRTGNSGAKFQNRDVLFPRITPSVENGKAGFVQFLKEGQVSIGSTEIIVFREKELNPEFIYFLSREHEFRGNAINSMVGASGRQRVQQSCFDAFLVAKPPKDLQQKFADIVSPMFKMVHTLTLKNANLRRTRDLLLPRLVSGEVVIG